MNLKDWRAKHKLTQPEAAELIGMSLRGIQDAEQSRITRKPIQLACRHLDLMLAPSAEKAAYYLRRYRKTWFEKKGVD